MGAIPDQPQTDVPAVAMSDLDDSVRLLDVRNDDEWEAGRAPNALHIPLPQLEERLAEVPKEGRLVVTCKGGGRASRAVAFLREQGYDAHNLTGGMQAWHKGNRPMTRDGNGTPEVI